MEKLKDISIKIVGFKVGVDRAVFYKKLHLPSDPEFGKWMNTAFHSRGCDFVSVRKVRSEDPLKKPEKLRSLFENTKIQKDKLFEEPITT